MAETATSEAVVAREFGQRHQETNGPIAKNQQNDGQSHAPVDEDCCRSIAHRCQAQPLRNPTELLVKKQGKLLEGQVLSPQNGWYPFGPPFHFKKMVNGATQKQRPHMGKIKTSFPGVKTSNPKEPLPNPPFSGKLGFESVETKWEVKVPIWGDAITKHCPLLPGF